ncbi:universal stress protein [Paeniglutamicibacter sp.]|uniref:universal stress protein n=1 Tax=Paeniglutamicibacter sp. TaxID=1934391 RepID=UPI00398A0FC7
MSTEGTFNYPIPAPEPAPAGSIVVGHDGSNGADDALAMALELAQELKAPVVVSRAWSIATAPRPAQWEFGYVPAMEEFTAAVREELERNVRPIAEKFKTVPITYEPVHAPPAKSLIAISHEARMLVVGTRGRGGLKGMLLGSVSEQCVRHAACPVLVVRPSA